MKCKNCGGELVFQNGMAYCENCKNTFRFDYGFEDTEVYICYIESDIQGRRTKDSVIADEIYQKLENKKIHSFYERKSVPAMIGDDLQAANYQAIYNAKIILIIGISIANFEHLVSKYSKYFKDKTVIPVYEDINPSDLPLGLNRLQALNYSAVGSGTDLINGVLRRLGREKEIELETIHKRQKKQKRIIAILISLFVIIGIITIAVLLIFNKSLADKAEPELSTQEIYDDAQTLMELGDYLGAADLFSTIPNFKNSASLLDEIYNRYDGYYLTEDKNVSFYINIQNAATADLILEKTASDGKKVRAEESAELNNHSISAFFTDSESNTGEITVTLNNDSIHVTTLVQSDSTAFSVGNLDLTFLVAQRSDRPMEQSITSETLNQWLLNRTSLSELRQAGYQIEKYKDMTSGGAINEHLDAYQIQNTDIKLLMADFDLSFVKSYDDIEKYPLDDFYIVGVIAPAGIACPQEIRQSPRVYEENDILYASNVQDFELMSDDWQIEYCIGFTFSDTDIDKSIGDNSLMGLTSKMLIGDNFNWVVSDLSNMFLQNVAVSQFRITYQISSEENITSFIVEENSNAVLISINYNQIVYYYRGDKNIGEIEFITEISCNSGADESDTLWKNYPDLFSEFL